MLIVSSAALAAIAVVALLAFEPWTLFTDTTVHEDVPLTSTASSAGGAMPSPSVGNPKGPAASPSVAPTAEPPAPEVIAAGTFISHEHPTTGTVQVLRLADGGRVLRIEDLDTSNGPDLHVWLADAEVVAGRGGWFVFDDREHVDLGQLKGNRGDQNYAIPAEVNLDQLSSVSIWCERFHVSFGAAALTMS